MPDFSMLGNTSLWSDVVHQTNVANNASANTKGNWVQLVSSTAHDAAWVMVGVRSGGAARCFCDIGVGAAASEVVLIPNLLHAETQNADALGWYLVPCHIPSGTRIAARVQRSSAAGTSVISLALGAPTLAGDPPLGFTEAAGLETADTSGIAVDPGASANTYGAWTELIAATTYRSKWLNLFVGQGANVVVVDAYVGVQIGVGAGGSEQTVFETFMLAGSSPRQTEPMNFSVPLAIPTGSRVAARLRSGDNAAGTRVLDVAAWLTG